MTLKHRRSRIQLALRVGILVSSVIFGMLVAPLNAFGQFADSQSQLQLTRDRDAEQWLRRADDARLREDWKLLADTLHRIHRDFGSVPVGNHRDEPRADSTSLIATAGSRAWELLLSAPPEALETYRVVYEADARAAFDAAMADHNWDGLFDVVSLYLPCDAGIEAAETLSIWMIDRGRWLSAERLLNSLRKIPNRKTPTWRIDMQLSFVRAVVGDRAGATTALAAVKAVESELPEAIRSRLNDLEAIIADPSGMVTPQVVREWPQLLGPSFTRGRMQSLEPDILADDAQRVDLPNGMDIEVQTALNIIMRKIPSAPVWQAVTDGRSLFTATPTGFAAFDLNTLELRGQPYTSAEKARRDQISPQINGRFGILINNTPNSSSDFDKLSIATQQALRNELSGAVTIVGNMALFVEQPTSINHEDQLLNETTPNTLTAYDTRTFKQLWAKGAAGPLEDGLTEAHFFATPVAIRDHLAALATIGAELVVLILDHNGSEVHRIPLGSSLDQEYPPCLLAMTSDSDELYIQTGFGVVVAMSGIDFSLLWAQPYERNLAPIGQRERRIIMARGGAPLSQARLDTWNSNPPLVAGDVLIVAPVDADRLFAFDRSTGRMRWSVPRILGNCDTFRFVIGADRNRVFVSGAGVAAFPIHPDAPNAPQAWSQLVPEISGRPALAGDQIFVPTLTGLTVLDSNTGNVIREVSDASIGALGNLLVWDDALYSIELNAIRRFSDLNLELAKAERTAETHRTLENLLRLAQVYLRLERPADALATLGEFADPNTLTGEVHFDPEILDDLAHVRVSAAIRLSETSALALTDATEANRIEALLRSADGHVRRSDDAVRVNLLLAEYEARDNRQIEAMYRLYDMLRRHLGDIPMQVDRHYRLGANMMIAEKLAHIWTDAPAEHQQRFLKSADEHLSGELAGSDTQIRAIADAMGFCDVGAKADLRVATLEHQAGLYESAEFYLRRAVRRARSPELQGTALSGLVVHLCFPPPDIRPRLNAAMPYLARLRSLPADTAITPLPLTDSQLSVDSVGGLLKTLESMQLGMSAESPSKAPTDWGKAVTEPSRTNPGAASHMCRLINDAQDELTSLVAIAVTSDTLIGIDTSPEGACNDLWQVQLFDMPGDDGQPMPIIEINEQYQPTEYNDYAPGAVAGAVAAVPADRSVQFVGLASGRVTSRPAVISTRRTQIANEAIVTSNNGMFVVAVAPNSVVGLPARNDSKPVWRRSFPTASLAWIQSCGDYVVAADSMNRQIWTLDPQSGRLRHHIDLPVSHSMETIREADGRRRHSVCVVGSHIVSMNERELTVRDVVSGDVLWKKTLDFELRDVRPLDSRHIGVSGMDDFVVFAASSGNEVGRVLVRSALLPPLNAQLLKDDRLLLAIQTDEGAADEPMHNPLIASLQWYSLKTGDMVTSVGNIPLATITDSMFSSGDDVVAVVANNRENGRIERHVLKFYNRQTGQRLLFQDLEDPESGIPVKPEDVVVTADHALILSANKRWTIAPEVLP